MLLMSVLLMSDLSGHGVVVCGIGLPLKFAPCGCDLALFGATLFPLPTRGGACPLVTSSWLLCGYSKLLLYVVEVVFY